MKKTRLGALLFAVWLIAAGCGYEHPHLSGNQGPGPDRTIHLAMWANRTNELGLEADILRAQSRWFDKAAHIDLVRSRDEADLILTGEILSVNQPGLSYGRHERVKEVRLEVLVGFSLTAPDGSIVWQEPGLTYRESFFVEETAAGPTRDNREKALARLVEDLAEQVYLGTLDRLSESRASDHQTN